MSEVREFRIYRAPRAAPKVQYGFWAPSATGIQLRFRVLREWKVSDEEQARALKEQMEIDVLLDPKLRVPPDATPLPSRQSQRRDMRKMPENTRILLERAVAGLDTDALPDLITSHSTLGTIVPQPYRGGRHFGAYLADPVYTRLVAMAAAAGVSRNRMLEALVLAADGFGSDE